MIQLVCVGPLLVNDRGRCLFRLFQSCMARLSDGACARSDMP